MGESAMRWQIARGRWRGALRTTLLLFCAGLCFTAAALANHGLTLRRSVMVNGRELMYFPSGRLLSVLAVGDKLLAADLVWLRGLQYYGEHRLTDQRYDHIGHIFDIATTLDPQFESAYLFGGLVLATEGKDVRGAIRFMQRGLAHSPRSYLLAFEIGFLYHVGLRDMPHAAYYYRRAASEPDCPEQVRRFAAFACERSQLDTEALALWEELARTSVHPALRQLAVERAAMIRRATATEVAD